MAICRYKTKNVYRVSEESRSKATVNIIEKLFCSFSIYTKFYPSFMFDLTYDTICQEKIEYFIEYY